MKKQNDQSSKGNKKTKLVPLMVFLFVLGVGVLGIGNKVEAATYYMNADGSEDCSNLQECFGIMSGGDTLIIRDGTYTGAANMISTHQKPPAGTSDAYTVIRAENPGKVIFDGEMTNTPVLIFGDGDTDSSTMRYVEFHGLIWKNSSGNVVGLYGACHHVKFFECGAAEPAGANDVGFSLGQRNGYEPHDILFEDCFAWGAGHYKFSVYHGHEIVFRRCVMRYDYVGDTTWPKGGIAVYGSSNVEVQNCLAIDGDTRSLWANTDQVDGAFYTPNNSEYSTNVFFRGCMALNWDMPFSGTRGDDVGSATFENCVGWGTWSGDSLSRATTSYRKNTFGNFTHPSSPAFDGYGGTTSMINSIFYGISTNVFNMYETIDNNSFYNCPTHPTGTNSITTINPLNNSLLYLPRIEQGSDLANAGSDGEAVGATMMNRIGVSGTLYGEPGYNTVTSDPLWPWPNENIIKEQMATYNLHGVNGARGFCALGNDQFGKPLTLTRYIWQYLGNQIPCEIYDECSSSNQYRADVDNNSQINTTDAMLTLRNSLGLSMTNTNWQASSTTGDVNCDGNSNSTDAMLILRYSLGLDMSETGWCGD